LGANIGVLAERRRKQRGPRVKGVPCTTVVRSRYCDRHARLNSALSRSAFVMGFAASPMVSCGARAPALACEQIDQVQKGRTRFANVGQICWSTFFALTSLSASFQEGRVSRQNPPCLPTPRGPDTLRLFRNFRWDTRFPCFVSRASFSNNVVPRTQPRNPERTLLLFRKSAINLSEGLVLTSLWVTPRHDLPCRATRVSRKALVPRFS